MDAVHLTSTRGGLHDARSQTEVQELTVDQLERVAGRSMMSSLKLMGEILSKLS